jgi:AcrR family transcriptional regulator
MVALLVRTKSSEKMVEGGLESKPARRLGRKRDHTRDGDILDAAIEVLAKVGYDSMTVDMVAMRVKAGKATVYRRWPSKAGLVLAAVTRMKSRQVDLGNLPDTGTLRGDLLALFKPQSIEEGERKLRVMAGFASMLLQDREFADAGNAAIVEPWAAANRTLIGRAIERGEVAATAHIETVAQVIPSMAAYRALIQRKPFDRAFLIAMIDGVLLPALLRSATAAKDLDRSSR